MKTTSTLAFFCILCALYIRTFSYNSFSQDCALESSREPYQPSGECIDNDRKVIYWESIPSTLCCRNALTFFSQALAQRARENTNTSIFLEQNEWQTCSAPFTRQNVVSAKYCGFDGFSFGNGKCANSSSLSLIQRNEEFQGVLQSCSRFNSTTFADACRNCTTAVVKFRDYLLEEFNADGDDDNEKATCGLAVVITVTAANFDDRSSLADLYNCLHSIDQIDPGFIRFKTAVVKAIMAVLIATFVMMLILVLIKHVAKSKIQGKNKGCMPKRKSPKPTKEIYSTTWSGLYRFSKDEIENAINNDWDRRFLGRGSAGLVYKGVLPSGQVVAIKHIYKSNNTDSFSREVEGLSRVRHPNLVCLFGCCVEGGEQYLVYEFCAAGNLAQHLLRKDSVLTWERRVKILRDCALALRYLHHYIDGCIVHRDIKLTNILLTEKLEPKLSDFGLAKMLGIEESKVFTDVRGTIGYMDPEYMTNAKLTCASDIYSFGIVALQLLSGQKVIELDFDARDQLTRKARDVSMGKRPIKDFEDPRLNGNINRADFESILKIAVLCVAKSSKGRPTIDVVYEEIDKAWKNTMEGNTDHQVSSPATTTSRSLEVILV
ncbi:protein kinase domain-containing protein [Citrus sinensis]|uniref:probable receptor-like protein kinase At2g42960 n=1 Tax=Citrus sinensis TaxID=2711 RepID=UPI00219A1DD7|nr:probable receptor-like protein kinase At2g42960 [Citrus sinensis]KAH9728300.1 protein kinase domain-containing protein [Citrus sinensis]